jgi:DNA-binding NarL/FixJ family response regulator
MGMVLDRDRGIAPCASAKQGGKEEANMQHQNKGGVAAETKARALTTRQAEILMLVAKGHADKEIAGELGISEETVSHHLRVMFAHCRVRSRAALVAALAHVLQKGRGAEVRSETYTNV